MVQSYGAFLVFSIIIFLHFLPGSFGNYFDCDPVNQGHYCLCAKGEPGVWDVQCPARILEVYPVSLKLSMSPIDPEEASLRIICDPNKGHFGWRLIQGLDFENDNITFSVTSLEISYCPPISTIDLQNFFHQMKLDAEDIQSFSYQTWKRNITFPSDFLKIMPNLEIVDLRNNQLETLPSFQGLEYLNQLNLRGNCLASIPKDTFSMNPNLEQIRLGGNLLSKLEMPIFPDSLILLDLVDNTITSIANESFTNLGNLQILYLNNNPLERVESNAFSPLKNLTDLSLDNSKLFSLPVLKNLPRLTNLSISFSLFSSTKLVPTTTSGLDMTTETDTENTNYYSSTTAKDNSMMTTGSDYTDVSEVISEGSETMMFRERSDEFDRDQDEELIGDLFALRKLILINDDLKTLSWLGYLPNLTDLVLSRNELQHIPEGFFRNMPSVLHVDISKNSISELSEMNAPVMTYLDLSNNFIKLLDVKYFKDLGQLKILILSSNKIEYVHPKAFENLQNLVILDLSNNRISFEQASPVMSQQVGLQYDMMTTTLIPTTTTFDWEDEKMDDSQRHSPLQYCTKLERISLRNNLIKKVFMDWTFVPLRLKSLDLSHNKIKNLHPRDLYFVSQDVRFDVRYNEITDVDMDFAELLLEPLENKNIIVMLDGNPLHCDCHAISFKRFSVKSYKLHYSDLRCASPDNLVGKRFAEISAKDLRCMISQSCPQGCSCWELPSENLIKMDCSALNFGSISGRSSLRNFTDVHEPLEFEIDLSARKLRHVNDTFIKEITSQIRLVNLTKTGLTSMEFLNGLPENNNVTKFALSKNPFKCDGCKFQKIWWKHYKRIVDIRSVTCIIVKDGANSTELVAFQDLVRSTVCTEEVISDEIRFLIIVLAIVIPMIIATLICIAKQRRERQLTAKKVKGTESIFGTQPRAYTPTRSKVADMDNSKF